jgi:hypothetical protein
MDYPFLTFLIAPTVVHVIIKIRCTDVDLLAFFVRHADYDPQCTTRQKLIPVVPIIIYDTSSVSTCRNYIYFLNKG